MVCLVARFPVLLAVISVSQKLANKYLLSFKMNGTDESVPCLPSRNVSLISTVHPDSDAAREGFRDAVIVQLPLLLFIPLLELRCDQSVDNSGVAPAPHGPKGPWPYAWTKHLDSYPVLIPCLHKPDRAGCWNKMASWS